MSKGIFIAIFGAGGFALDPAGGQRTIAQKAISRGLTCRAEPYDYTDTQTICDAVRAFAKANPALPIFLEGDSCGANVLTQLIADLAPLTIAAAFPIQASMYCNFNYPGIKSNCERFLGFYSDFALTGGLGTFIAQPESVPAKPVIRGPWHVVNGGKTLYQMRHVPAPHPDDQDVANVQNPIFIVVDDVLAAQAVS